jgi:elongation factor Ts
MTISAAQVKELREVTGLGMMICKKALSHADGDMQKAIKDLQKQGQATARKRAGKAAKEGKVSVVVADAAAVIYEVNSETDFVARNEDFLAFADELGTLLMSSRPAELNAAMALPSAGFGGQTVAERQMELVGKIGEKIALTRFCLIEIDRSKQRLYSYVHGNGRIGVVVTLSAEKPEVLDSEEVSVLGKELAMQIAAASPTAIDRDRIAEETVAKEREIYLAQAQASGRPEKVWERIVEGKLTKFFKESTLLEQEYIRDSDMSVTDRIRQCESTLGSSIAVDRFVRYGLGTEQQLS